MSNSVWPHRRQPTRLPRPWDSPGKNTGVGCHFLLQCMKVKSESEVAQSYPTPSDPMACSPPGPSIHGIFQAESTGVGCHCSPQFMGSQRVRQDWATNTIVLIGWSHWFTIYLGFRLSFHLFIRLFPSLPNLTANSLRTAAFSLQFFSSVYCSALCLEYCRESECLEILGNSSINL